MNWSANWNLAAAVATVMGVPIALWAAAVTRRGSRKSRVRLQIGHLPPRWESVTLVYGLTQSQSLVAFLPLILTNHSKHVAADAVTLEVVIPDGANLPYRSDNLSIAAELSKGIMPGAEFRTAVVGNFVHVYCLLPNMNPRTNALFVLPFYCPETEVKRQMAARTKEGERVTLELGVSVELVFNTIVHTRDSPPSVSTFGVRGFVAENVEALFRIARSKGVFQRNDGPQRVRDRLLLRNRRVELVMPDSSPWTQDGIQGFVGNGDQAVPVFRENYEDSRRWLLSGYAGFSRMRPTRWRFR